MPLFLGRNLPRLGPWVAAILMLLVGSTLAAAAAKQPNILWLVSEDTGPYLGCYGDTFARTPNLDAMAHEGVLYLNAFANAPISAPSRSSLITGIYASSLGTLSSRCRYLIPTDVAFYAGIMKKAGYYCMNPGKTDYNIARPDRKAWDPGHSWKDAPEGKPWMLVLNTLITHESALDGAAVQPQYLKEPFNLPPYHPDTPDIRSDWVLYYHKITKMDAWVGSVLARLQKDGLADDTIVFYFSDNGGALPRGKRFVYDSGLHVPLIVRFGRNVQALAPAKPGTKLDRLASLIDLPPTLASVAGDNVPGQYVGSALFGPKASPERQYAFAFRGRVDERNDLSYTLRDKRYRYVHNYLPHRIYGRHLDTLWKVPATVSWDNAYHMGVCDGTQSAFWEVKPTEELYDEQADPCEVKNLADYPTARNELERMRKALDEQLLANRDTGLLPEQEMLTRSRRDPIFVMSHDPSRYPLERILEAADLASRRDSDSVPRLVELMKDPDPAARYWAAVGCSVRGTDARDAVAPLRVLLKDKTPCVRIAAAEALCRTDDAAMGLPALVRELRGRELDVLMALDALESLGSVAQPSGDSIAAQLTTLPRPRGENYCAHAAESLLNRLGVPTKSVVQTQASPNRKTN